MLAGIPRESVVALCPYGRQSVPDQCAHSRVSTSGWFVRVPTNEHLYLRGEQTNRYRLKRSDTRRNPAPAPRTRLLANSRLNSSDFTNKNENTKHSVHCKLYLIFKNKKLALHVKNCVRKDEAIAHAPELFCNSIDKQILHKATDVIRAFKFIVHEQVMRGSFATFTSSYRIYSTRTYPRCAEVFDQPHPGLLWLKLPG